VADLSQLSQKNQSSLITSLHLACSWEQATKTCSSSRGLHHPANQ